MEYQVLAKVRELKEAYFLFKTAPEVYFESGSYGCITHSTDKSPFDHFCEVAHKHLSDDQVVDILWEQNQPLLVTLVGFFTGTMPHKISIHRDRLLLGSETFILRMETSYRLFPEGECPHMPEAANPVGSFKDLLSKAATLCI